jgi:glycosyltransferase involved in cell wall biosynthesis
MLENRVYFIGLRYKHHAKHSGYEAFGRYIGTALPPPVNFRWMYGKYRWPLGERFARLTRHPWYSIGAHITEWGALKHMLLRKRCLFHILYADSDLWLLRRANKLTGNRLVASFHQPASDLRALGVVERVAKHLDAVILVSETQRPYFEEFLPPDRIFVVHHGVDSDFFCPATTTNAEPVCITVGSHLRDFETLRQAIRIVWASNPQMRFIAVGTRSDKKSYFPELDDPRIQFLDRISDNQLLRAYQKASVAIFAFKEATANNAMVEAMACGLPVVATDSGGISEYITDGVGLLCPPQDPQALAAATLRLLNDVELRRTMSEVSRQRALHLDFRRVATRMHEIYAGLLTPTHGDAEMGNIPPSNINQESRTNANNVNR